MKTASGGGTGMAQLVDRPTLVLAQVMILWFVVSSPALGTMLCLESACASPSVPPITQACSVSQINLREKKKKDSKWWISLQWQCFMANLNWRA